MANNYQHIFLQGNVISQKYRAKGGGRDSTNILDRNRIIHSERLLKQLDEIWSKQQELTQKREANQLSTRQGTYLSFTGAMTYDLITESLEDLKKGIRLLNIQDIRDQNEPTKKQIRATVYIPKGKENHFITKIKKYQTENTKKNKPKNSPLVDSIEDISIALVESLWTDNIKLLPTENSKWCEVWLNINTNNGQELPKINIFKNNLEELNISYKPDYIIFPERVVLLVDLNLNLMIELLNRSDLLAEFRSGQEPAGFWVNETSIEQESWVQDLLARLEFSDSNIKICILDNGVNNGHLLLKPLLDESDMLTVNPDWLTHDHEGHGTLMAGITGYGKLDDALLSSNSIVLSHKLCSVKTFPPPHREGTPKELWGDITAQGIARAEIKNPNKFLIFCMAVTSTDDVDKGRPSSWSGAIDNITFGNGDSQKLFIISAGNMNHEHDLDRLVEYPVINYNTSIQNPAQSWNALVIGAYTDKIRVNTDKIRTNDTSTFEGYKTIANAGELSPHSTTSCMWEKIWPFKPDVVFEGGNLLKSPNNEVSKHADLALLSTSKNFNLKPFATIEGTSASAAQAAWFAAKVAYEYPNAWPETIRGLIVHSAEWNDAMRRQMNVNDNSRANISTLLKTFGYGFPDLHKAIYSQENALTFISEQVIQPFGLKEDKTPETNEIHIFNFPWPKEVLMSMSDISVKLKITLSYFIEPGAGAIGWKDKYRYQSHGLRFDVNNRGEDEVTFIKRVNAAAREQNESFLGKSGSERWKIGINNRKNGSIHSDYWEGTAADLATCNLIAVYPVIGWWRERKHLGKVENKTRYSLIVSLETPVNDVELYTTVKNMIDIPVEITT